MNNLTSKFDFHLVPVTNGRRRGSVAVFVMFMLVVVLTMAVFAVDYGYLLVARTDLQRTADQAVLAAVQDLVPDQTGFQDVDKAKATLRDFVVTNTGQDFTVDDTDVKIGRYDPDSVYSGLTILDNGTFDTVRVTLRRDDLTNSSVSLFLARLLGVDGADISVTATAVLRKARYLPPGTDLLPIAINVTTWNNAVTGYEWSIYGDGRLLDGVGNPVPGNWGTLDVGATSNSTADLSDQILNGLRSEDLDSLAAAGTIPDATHIDSQQQMWLNGDTGFSAGIKSSVIESHGKTKLIPLFDTTNSGNGGNFDFHVVGWGVVEIVDSNWNGNKKTFLRIRKTYSYDGDLRAHHDLSNTNQIINNAFTTPALVQ